MTYPKTLNINDKEQFDKFCLKLVRRKMKPNIEQFVDELDFDMLIILARGLGLPFDHTQWTDDQWPDKEDELRVALAERLQEVEGGL
ncbi:hypothetical protein LCGC14_1283390 [marine sediment metagenome]|uniref:Uncharacterized protein n=1 Tax=marine sediment metagenome TaxID=412755 RepID=A0A0F9NXP3_9ZZZZ